MILPDCLSSVSVADECLLTFNHLKPKKSDDSDLDSSHFIESFPCAFVCTFFTIMLRHGESAHLCT